VALEAHLKRYLVNYWCHNSAAELLDGVGGRVAAVPSCQEVKEAWLLVALGVGYCLVRQQHPAKVPAKLPLAVPPPMLEPKVQS